MESLSRSEQMLSWGQGWYFCTTQVPSPLGPFSGTNDTPALVALSGADDLRLGDFTISFWARGPFIRRPARGWPALLVAVHVDCCI